MMLISALLHVASAYRYRTQHDNGHSRDDAGAILTSWNRLFPNISDKIGESVLEINPHYALTAPRRDLQGPFIHSSTESFDLGPQDVLPMAKGLTLMIGPRKDRPQGKVTVYHYTNPLGVSARVIVPHIHTTTLLQDGRRRAAVRVMMDDDLDPITPRRTARKPTRLVSSASGNLISRGLLVRERTSLLDSHVRQHGHSEAQLTDDADDFNYVCSENPREVSVQQRKHGWLKRQVLKFEHMLGRTWKAAKYVVSQQKEHASQSFFHRLHKAREIFRRYDCQEDDHCLRCTDKNRCGKCELGFGLAKSGYDSCGKCPKNCSECRIAARDPESGSGQCDRCNLGLSLESGGCKSWAAAASVGYGAFVTDRNSPAGIRLRELRRQKQLEMPVGCNFVIRNSDLPLLTGRSWEEETNLVLAQYKRDSEEKSGVTLSTDIINGEGPRVKRIRQGDTETGNGDSEDDEALRMMKREMKSGTSYQVPLSFVGLSAVIVVVTSCL